MRKPTEKGQFTLNGEQEKLLEEFDEVCARLDNAGVSLCIDGWRGCLMAFARPEGREMTTDDAFCRMLRDEDYDNVTTEVFAQSVIPDTELAWTSDDTLFLLKNFDCPQ